MEGRKEQRERVFLRKSQVEEEGKKGRGSTCGGVTANV